MPAPVEEIFAGDVSMERHGSRDNSGLMKEACERLCVFVTEGVSPKGQRRQGIFLRCRAAGSVKAVIFPKGVEASENLFGIVRQFERLPQGVRRAPIPAVDDEREIPKRDWTGVFDCHAAREKTAPGPVLRVPGRILKIPVIHPRWNVNETGIA